MKVCARHEQAFERECPYCDAKPSCSPPREHPASNRVPGVYATAKCQHVFNGVDARCRRCRVGAWELTDTDPTKLSWDPPRFARDQLAQGFDANGSEPDDPDPFAALLGTLGVE